MGEAEARGARPIRVVVFGGGPGLQDDAARFLVLLAEHPQIDLVGAICQSRAAGLVADAKDLWRRRGVLGGPLLALKLAGRAARWLAHPWAERERIRRVRALTDRVRFVPDIHAPDVLERVRGMRADLGLVYGSPILKPELFEIPALGTLGIHHGKVPEYRGKKTTFWAMYHGEPIAGVTIQRLGTGLDRGEIVREGTVPAGGRSLGAVTRDLEVLGYRLYVEAILDVRAGRATFVPQPQGKGKLFRDPKPAQILSFWGRQACRRVRRAFSGTPSTGPPSNRGPRRV